MIKNNSLKSTVHPIIFIRYDSFLSLHCSKLCTSSYPPSSEYLCPKAKMSEALPLPSHTTTGTGGVSLRYSSTIEITLGPPSTIKATTGTPWPIPAHENKWQQEKQGVKSENSEEQYRDIAAGNHGGSSGSAGLRCHNNSIKSCLTVIKVQ